jgi:soluble lytic murein transglycosylase-like protein
VSKHLKFIGVGVISSLLTIQSTWANPNDTQSLDWILYGIAIVESGRGKTPWPWTLNVEGKPYFFIDRESAWNAAQKLTAHHYDHFDIGMMQVNWHYHRHRFRSIWEALDPQINRRIAEDILREQWLATGHLPSAIARYHSADPKLGLPYLKKVIRVLNELKNEVPQ